jgi:hypothetical protein
MSHIIFPLITKMNLDKICYVWLLSFFLFKNIFCYPVLRALHHRREAFSMLQVPYLRIEDPGHVKVGGETKY